MFESTLTRHCSRAVPIILIDNSIDQLATVRQVLSTVKYNNDEGHDLLYIWSMSDGLQMAGATESGKVALAQKLLKNAEGDEMVGGYTMNPVPAMRAIKLIVEQLKSPDVRKLGSRAGFVFYMGNRVLRAQDNENCNQVVQMLMDLRDELKLSRSAIYFVGINFDVPPELKEHIVILNAPLPSEEKYGEIVDQCYGAYRSYVEALPEADPYTMTEEERLVFLQNLKGMSEFAAEQTIYLSTDVSGVNLKEIQERAVQTISSTRGLSVHKGDGRGFEAIGGLNNIKQYTRRLIDGRLKAKVIVYIDEVEKVLAGSAGGDSSGVSQNFLGTLLSAMQDTNSLGLLLAGVYGAGKSEFAKRMSEESKSICIHMDLAGMKDSLVGNSEANLRRAMNVIESIGGKDGGIMYVATCNRIGQLPPEFKRRFNLGTFFFYFPDADEKRVIWDIYLKKYGIDEKPAELDDTNWTGAEIESCCRLAHLMQSDLVSASKMIVPVAKTAKAEIEKLVDEAHDNFISTSYEGPFQKPSSQPKSSFFDTAPQGRKNAKF